MSPVRRQIDPPLDQIVPPQYVSRGASGTLRCAAGQATVRASASALCAYRGIARTASTSDGEACTRGTSPARCHPCASWHGPTSLTALRVAVSEGALCDAILTLTFRHLYRAAQPCGLQRAAPVRAAPVRAVGRWPEDTLPVPFDPLDPDRMHARGYNQPDLLARDCTRVLGVSSRANHLAHRRDTRPQVGPRVAERHVNVFDAVALASARGAALRARRRILLVDDAATAVVLPLRPAAVWGPSTSHPDLAIAAADAADTVGASRYLVAPAARRTR